MPYVYLTIGGLRETRKRCNFAHETYFDRTMTKDDLRQQYAAKAHSIEADIRRLKRRGSIFLGTELASFMAAVGCVVAFTVWGGWPWLAAAALLMAAYIATRRLDQANSSRTERQESLRNVYLNELKYLDGDFSPFDDGNRYADPKHPFTFDMDVFGPLSLYHRICRAVTSGGADRLAHHLSTISHADPEEAKARADSRREALGRLAAMEPLRAEFMAAARHGHIDTEAVKAALRRTAELEIPTFARSPIAVAVAAVAIAGFAATILLAALTPVEAGLPVAWGVAQFSAVYLICSKPLRMTAKAAGNLQRQLGAYAELISLICTTDLRQISRAQCGESDCTAEDGAARKAFGELKGIIDGLDRRGNVLGLVLFDTLLLSDFFLVRRFLAWRRNYVGRMERWIDGVSEMDALVSMATFRYNEPAAGHAEISTEGGVRLEAEGLWHPFLGERAVSNDFTIANNNYYIVTGANMAGKSTFLRAIGVNYILAMNGMPVFARKLRITVFNLFCSMRTSDDLSHGISYFNAELLRLKQLIGSCKQADHTLIILDEILKGTNSLDKLNGSRMFLDAIAALPVSGVIATHDLELSRMADERPQRFSNWCFEIGLAERITYTYKITPGVARNQNATFLLRNIIAEIAKS